MPSIRMPLIECLDVLRRARRDDEVVITAMGTAREWMQLGSHPLDFVFVPSSMGQASSLGLGMALARPEQNFIVCNGDGSTLMNLGSLVTITAEAPKNLTLLLFDNRVYEVTGSQTTPGSSESRCDNRDVDFGSLARACGFQSVFEFKTLQEWQDTVRDVIDATGPTCAWIKVAPIPNAGGPRSPSPGRKRAVGFADALRKCSVSAK